MAELKLRPPEKRRATRGTYCVTKDARRMLCAEAGILIQSKAGLREEGNTERLAGLIVSRKTLVACRRPQGLPMM